MILNKILATFLINHKRRSEFLHFYKITRQREHNAINGTSICLRHARDLAAGINTCRLVFYDQLIKNKVKKYLY